MFLALMLEFHAWSSARPMQESDRTADALEKEINELMGTEKEQGMSLAPSLPLNLVGRPMFSIHYWPSPWKTHTDIIMTKFQRRRVKG